jgi:hypothetical protein
VLLGATLATYVLLGATLATYGLLGATPIATVIEKNTLTALYNIARHEDFIEQSVYE